MADITQKIAGINFSSPFMVAAGPLTDRVDLIVEAAKNGAGAVSLKRTDFSQSKPGVRKMYAQRGNYFFNPSDRRLEMHETIRLIEQVKRRTDIPVFANILADGEDLQSWVALGKAMEEAGADALELNFACPNPKAPSGSGTNKFGAAISRDTQLACSIIQTMTSALSIPVWPKLSGEGIDSASVAAAASKAGATGAVLFYSPRGAFPIDIYCGGRPRIADLIQCSFGGINGPAIREMSSRVIAEVALKLPDLPIIGGGGISDFRHGVEKIMFGASLIFLLTHLILEGIAEIRKMNEQLSRFMDENGYNTIQDMRGLALAHIIPNSELEPHIGPPAKIDASCCVGCGACAKISTCQAITVVSGRAVVDEGQCECCGLCASVCPCAAISFGKEV